MRKRFSIFSGGQSGVDRAALDFALENRIICGGFCPFGRKAEDGPINQKYPLIESHSPESKIRTDLNVLLTDGTLILYVHKMDQGTELTYNLAKKYNIPLLVLDLNEESYFNSLKNWINYNNLCSINIAGPRESNSPGIYNNAKRFLDSVFKQALQQK